MRSGRWPSGGKRAWLTLGAVWIVGLLAALGAIAGDASAATQWDNVAEAVGVVFQQAGEVHIEDDPGFESETGFPEIIGGGACFADLDGDGWDDLYLVSQQYNPENNETHGWAERVDETGRLFLNQGDATFRDVTRESGLVSHAWGYGCSVADYDGDRDLDLFLANYGPNELFRNDGDLRFTNVTVASGVGMNGACGAARCMSTGSAWADYDGDEDLDLYVANYVASHLEDEDYGPQDHDAQLNFLHRNNGDGTFTELAQEVGVAGVAGDVPEGGKSFSVIWFDADLDGDMDLFVANDETYDDFYVNNGDGTFTERSDEAGLADPRAGMGLTIADYDGDAYPDIFITHYERQDYGFYHNAQDGTFEDRSGEDGLADLEDWVGWGTGFTDIDRDGDLDLVTVHGHTAFLNLNYANAAQVFRNDPPAAGDPQWDREWVRVSDESGPGIAEVAPGRGAAFADYDLDGDTDIVRNNNGNASAQFLQASDVDGHFLNLRLAQPGANTFAIGAKVKLEAAGLAPQFREVQAGASFLSQNALTLEFGLGDASEAERITVTWPDGGTTMVQAVAADQTVRIDRATGAVLRDVLAPVTTFALAGVAGEAGWFLGPVEATLEASDVGSPTVSGVVRTESAVEDGAWTEDEGAALLFTEEGVHALHGRSVDADGNQEPRRTTSVRIDTTPPTFAHDLDGVRGEAGWWVSPAVRVTFAADDALSGVQEARYRVDGGEWQVVDGPVDVAGDGEHVLEATAVDVAGNEAEVVRIDIAIDAGRPDVAFTNPTAGSLHAGELHIDTGLKAPAVIVVGPGLGVVSMTVTADAQDPTSGISRVVLLLDGEQVAVDTEAPYAWEWDLAAARPGAHTIEAIALDVAGNLATARSEVLLINGSAPMNAAQGARGGPLALADARAGARHEVG